MSGECDKCNEHCLDCVCDLKPWYGTEEGKQHFLEIVNDRFKFNKDGSIEDR